MERLESPKIWSRSGPVSNPLVHPGPPGLISGRGPVPGLVIPGFGIHLSFVSGFPVSPRLFLVGLAYPSSPAFLSRIRFRACAR